MSPDPNRQTRALVGIFRWESREVRLGDQIVLSRDPYVHFNTEDLAGVDIREGDIIVRPDVGEFQVKAVKPDGVYRTTVELVQLGRHDVLK